MHSHIFTNKNGNTLMREFEGVLSNNPAIKNMDAVVGFLRASGYFTLRPFLDNINKARVLVGINVDKYIAEAARQGKIFFGAEDEVKEDCLRQIRHDIEHSGYKEEIEQGIFQMVKDIHDGKLELRAHPSKRIHAKIYVLYPDNFNQYTGGIAITGSSNLSGNGLGISEDKQYEFNVKLSQYDDVQYAKDEFEELWKEAEVSPLGACARPAPAQRRRTARAYRPALPERHLSDGRPLPAQRRFHRRNFQYRDSAWITDSCDARKWLPRLRHRGWNRYRGACAHAASRAPAPECVRSRRWPCRLPAPPEMPAGRLRT